MARPKIALLYVGGSIGMMRNLKTGRIDPVESIGEMHRFLPELQKEVSLDFIPVSNIESSAVTPVLWTTIARRIEAEYDKYDGFVLVHGTNTLSYTASALSFALQGLSKPIVCTGSLLPINDVVSDGRSNLAFAIRTATLDIAEVCIVLGTKILRGNRAKKSHESIDHTFASTRFPALGEFTRSFELHPWRMVRRKRSLECKPTFNGNVTILTLHPGLPDNFLNAVLQSNLHGIIMRSYGPGMIPESLTDWVRELTDRHIPIVMTSQVLDSSVDLHRYKKQLILEKLGIISGKDMTYECALAKLMWALTQTKKLEKLHTIMESDLVGELTE